MLNNYHRHISLEPWARVAAVAALLWLLGAGRVMAQADMQYSQYYEIGNLYNPGAAGSTDLLRMRGASRMQWVGIKNAPYSIGGSGDMPVRLGTHRLGVGLVTETEGYGLFHSLQIGAQVAYKKRKFGGEFSAGLQLGMYDQRFKGRDVILPDDDDYHEGKDDAIPTRDIHGAAFDMSAGVHYTHPKFWAGLSCMHLTSPTISMRSEKNETGAAAQAYEFQANRTFYLMGGCNIQLKNTLIELLPSVLVKSDLTFTTGEATLRARYNKTFVAGLGYRWHDAVYITLAAEIRNIYLGYTYDYSTSAIAKATSGSHEVFLGYSMKIDLSDKNKNKHKSIRIM